MSVGQDELGRWIWTGPNPRDPSVTVVKITASKEEAEEIERNGGTCC